VIKSFAKIYVISKNKITPSYFELLIAFVYWIFEREAVDYAVIETGMGGLLDGTNVAHREDKVCVITDIGFDHIHILGNTLSEIAEQKAGIIHENNHVFMYKQSDEIMKQIENRVVKTNAKLTVYIYDDLLKRTGSNIAMLPNFQKRNWLIAEQTVRAISKRDKFIFDENKNPDSIVVPGRMDVKLLSDKSILIMDGAHNAQKTTTFVESFKSIYPHQKVVIMLALKRGKEYREVVDILSEVAESFILTTFTTTQDLPAVAQDPANIAEYCKEIGKEYDVINDNQKATACLLAKESNIKLIIGSFYLLGQVRRFL
jgi:dihydrofolate synthase/folylpolyglutamate synthase